MGNRCAIKSPNMEMLLDNPTWPDVPQMNKILCKAYMFITFQINL